MIKEAVQTYLRDKEIAKKIRPVKPVRMRYNGHFICTSSGKSLWKRIGDAKSALKHDLVYYEHQWFRYYSSGAEAINVLDKKGYTRAEVKKYMQAVYEALLKEIEFVEV